MIYHFIASIYYRPQRSCGQGYVFTRVCDSVNGGGLRRTPPPGTRQTRPPDQGEPPSRLGESPPGDQADTPPPRDQGDPPGPGRPRPPRPREEDCSIRSMSGQYASYWKCILVAEDFTEELLEQHDTEVQRMKQLYDDNQNMFEKVARRQKLWVEFLEFEVNLIENFLEICIGALNTAELFMWSL